MRIELLTYNYSGISFKYKKYIEEVCQKVLLEVLPKINPVISEVELSLVLVTPGVALELNKVWRKKRYIPLDLSFPNFGRLDLKKNKERSIILGDIFLTPELILGKENYKKMVVHSLLHLLGYDHENEKDFKKMQKLEQTL